MSLIAALVIELGMIVLGTYAMHRGSREEKPVRFWLSFLFLIFAIVVAVKSLFDLAQGFRGGENLALTGSPSPTSPETDEGEILNMPDFPPEFSSIGSSRIIKEKDPGELPFSREAMQILTRASRLSTQDVTVLSNDIAGQACSPNYRHTTDVGEKLFFALSRCIANEVGYLPNVNGDLLDALLSAVLQYDERNMKAGGNSKMPSYVSIAISDNSVTSADIVRLKKAMKTTMEGVGRREPYYSGPIDGSFNNELALAFYSFFHDFPNFGYYIAPSLRDMIATATDRALADGYMKIDLHTSGSHPTLFELYGVLGRKHGMEPYGSPNWDQLKQGIESGKVKFR